MKKVYFLSSCSSCQRILKENGLEKKGFDLQDIKTNPMTAIQLDEMKEMSGSYESLFSRRAIKYRELRLKDKTLSEKEIRNLILTEYTFLKRPVVIIENEIFIGNDKKMLDALKRGMK